MARGVIPREEGERGIRGRDGSRGGRSAGEAMSLELSGAGRLSGGMLLRSIVIAGQRAEACDGQHWRPEVGRAGLSTADASCGWLELMTLVSSPDSHQPRPELGPTRPDVARSGRRPCSPRRPGGFVPGARPAREAKAPIRPSRGILYELPATWEITFPTVRQPALGAAACIILWASLSSGRGASCPPLGLGTGHQRGGCLKSGSPRARLEIRHGRENPQLTDVNRRSSWRERERAREPNLLIRTAIGTGTISPHGRCTPCMCGVVTTCYCTISILSLAMLNHPTRHPFSAQKR